MAATLQHEAATLSFRIQTASTREHHPLEGKADDALTFKLDQSTGAGHPGKDHKPSENIADAGGNLRPVYPRLDEATVEGEMYWSEDHIEAVKRMKREGRLDDAAHRLKLMVNAAHRESQMISEGGVAPWPFEQLAIVFRKQKKHEDEIRLLEIFMELPHAPGAGPQRLKERLEKARSAQLKRKTQRLKGK